MDVSVINTRIKKNRLIEHSGEYYRGMESKFIEEIQKGKTSKVLLGIEDNSNGTYTALGDQFVFFKNKNSCESKLSVADFLIALKVNAWNKGKSGKFDFVPLDDGRKIWVMNPATMSPLWNTAMMINRNRKLT